MCLKVLLEIMNTHCVFDGLRLNSRKKRCVSEGSACSGNSFGQELGENARELQQKVSENDTDILHIFIKKPSNFLKNPGVNLICRIFFVFPIVFAIPGAARKATILAH